MISVVPQVILLHNSEIWLEFVGRLPLLPKSVFVISLVRPDQGPCPGATTFFHLIFHPDIHFLHLHSCPSHQTSKQPWQRTMSVLLKALQAITPPPAAPAPINYDGLEYKWKMFVFRPAYFKFEGIALGVLGAYLLCYYLGKFYNGSRAKAL